MLVYGDPEFRRSFNSFRTELQNSLRRTCLEDLDALRSLLIRAGQLEQGVADAVAPSPGEQGLNRVMQATDRIADLPGGVLRPVLCARGT